MRSKQQFIVDVLSQAAPAMGYVPIATQPDNCLYVQHRGKTFAWNPLDEDADAFALAAQVIGTYTTRTWRGQPSNKYFVRIVKLDGRSGEGTGDSVVAATRLAIVNTVINNLQ